MDTDAHNADGRSRGAHMKTLLRLARVALGLGLLALVVSFLGVLTLNKGVAAASATGTPAAVETPAQR